MLTFFDRRKDAGVRLRKATSLVAHFGLLIAMSLYSGGFTGEIVISSCRRAGRNGRFVWRWERLYRLFKPPAFAFLPET